MSRFLSLPYIAKSCAARAGVSLLCLAGLAILPSAAWSQTFSLSMAPFNFDAVDPGGTDSANVTVNGSGVTVSLSCSVTPQQPAAVLPTCAASPTSVDAPGSTVATVNTAVPQGSTSVTATPGLYLITVTGTGGSSTQQQSEYLTVLSVAAQYTITIASAVTPSTVAAGLSGSGTISVNPLNGYTGTVTLSCSSITPLVDAYPPYCSFTYPSGQTGIPVSGTPQTVPIKVTSTGPASIPPNPGVSHHARSGGLGLWLALPALGFASLGAAAAKRSRKAWIVLAFFVLGASALLTPACNSVTTTPLTGSQAVGTTPNNTYTFTVTGVDTNGNPASNTGSSSAAPTVTLTVN